jgi:heme-degrading monooxygenase HmoA
LDLFKSTNPQLVSDQSDWIRATFSSVEERDIVIVNAEWKSKESYLNFSNSDKFKETMGQFGTYFKEKPKVKITKVLFEM